MPGGRPAKPTALKLLHGDDKKNPQRVNRAEPVPASVAVEAPDWLSPAALGVWEALAPDRIATGVLTAWDVDAFALFCEALVLARQGVSEARREAQPGAPSPMSKFKDAVGLCSSLGGRFGWTPSDRQKLVVGGNRRGPKDDLLSG
jgi:P27 family predicted phage terminase small subunit